MCVGVSAHVCVHMFVNAHMLAGMLICMIKNKKGFTLRPVLPAWSHGLGLAQSGHVEILQKTILTQG